MGHFINTASELLSKWTSILKWLNLLALNDHNCKQVPAYSSAMIHTCKTFACESKQQANLYSQHLSNHCPELLIWSGAMSEIGLILHQKITLILDKIISPQFQDECPMIDRLKHKTPPTWVWTFFHKAFKFQVPISLFCSFCCPWLIQKLKLAAFACLSQMYFPLGFHLVGFQG